MRYFRRRKANGTWVWWASWTENKVTVRRSTRKGTLDAAKLVGALWERERADPELAAARQATLGSEAVIFLRECRAADLADGTVGMYEQKLANVCDILGKETSLASIDAEMVGRYFTTRDDEGASESTQYKEWVALSGVLKSARHRGRFHREPSSLKPPRLTPGYKPRDTWLTWEQADALLEELPEDRRRCVAFVLATGARRSEWWRAQGVDFDARAGMVKIRGTKTDEAERTIPIPRPMRRWLKIAGPPPYPAWANARRGLHRACRRIEKRLQVAAKKRKVPEDELPTFPRVTWNDLRRTFVSLLVQAGVPDHVLRHLTGHKTTTMIQRVYGRQTPEAVRDLVERALRPARSPSVNQPRSTKRTLTRPGNARKH